jgi:D-aminoacyl-tRNA deacylase
VDGTRFGSPARTAAPDIALKTRRLPPGLAEAAGGVDAAAATDAVASEALAYGTADGGSRPAGRVALAVGDGYDRIVTGLVAVLREQYDDVTVTDDRVVARRLAFDPERARTLGVPEGPAFGRLADGEAVEVRGELIPPEQVSRERVDEFEIPDR